VIGRVPALVSLVLACAVACGACKGRPSGDQPAENAGSSPPPSNQTFEEAMRITCDAPENAELPPEKPGDVNRALLVAAWIDQRVTNPEVRQLMGAAAAAQTPAGKLAALRDGATKAGIERCALAEMWQRMATGAPAAAESAAAAPALPSEPQTYDEAIAILCDAPDPAALTKLAREKISRPRRADEAGAREDQQPGRHRARLCPGRGPTRGARRQAARGGRADRHRGLSACRPARQAPLNRAARLVRPYGVALGHGPVAFSAIVSKKKLVSFPPSVTACSSSWISSPAC